MATVVSWFACVVALSAPAKGARSDAEEDEDEEEEQEEDEEGDDDEDKEDVYEHIYICIYMGGLNSTRVLTRVVRTQIEF